MAKRRVGNTGRRIDRRERPKQAVCPVCGKRGLTAVRFSASGERGRECRYCLHWHKMPPPDDDAQPQSGKS